MGEWEKGRQAGELFRPAGRHTASGHLCLFASRESRGGGHFPTRPLKKLFCAESRGVRGQPSPWHPGWEPAAASGTKPLAGHRSGGCPTSTGSAAPLLAFFLSGRRAPLARPCSLPSSWEPERTLRKAAQVGAHPEGVLTFRWGEVGGGGGVVLGEEQPEEVRREVPGSRTEERSRGRRASASDGGDGDRKAAAAAETDTPPGGGSAAPALKAPRSFPPSPTRSSCTFRTTAAKRVPAQRSGQRERKCEKSGRPQT